MKKKRTEVPVDTAAQLQLLSNRTCCVCRCPKKTIQIHHIDENPSNHNIENLALLCLECHNETQIRGGFGRKLDAELVKCFRNAWHEDMARKQLQPHPEVKASLRNASLEKLQQTLNEINTIQNRNHPHPEVKASPRNASLEKLRQTLNEIDAIQSGK